MSYSRYHRTETRSNISVLGFSNQTRAFEMRDALLSLDREAWSHLQEAVVVTRDHSGQVRLHWPVAENALGGAGLGSLAGAILGAVFLMPGVGSAVGAGLGAIAASLVNLGVEEKFVRDVGTTLRPGTSALVLVGTEAPLDKLADRLGPLLKGTTLLHTTVNTEREAEIRQLLQTNKPDVDPSNTLL